MSDETLTAAMHAGTVEADVGVVRVVEGPSAGAQVTVTDGPVVIGKSDHADLTLADPTISRMHCELRPLGRELRLEDLGSKNGVWIAGVRVEAARLGHGARFAVGGCVLQVGIERRPKRVFRWEGGDRFGDLVGASPSMHELFGMLSRVAPSRMNVLVTGESGTGKELVARAVHDLSARAEGPFVVVDGGALSRTLADSELFGHVRGAFTGAHVDHEGAFERADGGTLFLDEIGELPLTTQVKLLRAVQEGTIQRLGDTTTRRVDVRIVSATHRDLKRATNDKTFREDLYFRLAPVVMELPPLRVRGGDIKLLARLFAQREAPSDPSALEVVDRAVDEMQGYRWPGNVRELQSYVHRVLLLGDLAVGQHVTKALDGPARVRLDVPFNEARKEWVEAFERQYLTSLLAEADGNVSEAARRAGLARSSMYQLLKRLGL